LEITFILPTINRKNYVIRAIDSCLHLNSYSKIIHARVLIYDGFSDDGAWETMKEKYSKNKDVTLKQIDRKLGFQETAFLALKDVKTEYCTYMYNDDVISKFYYELAHKMIENNQNFIMGYGKNEQVDNIYNFKKPMFKEVITKNIILNYFGFFNFLEFSSLPVSPVPSISKTEFLKKWVNEIRLFVENSTFRKELMLKKNIGPDLIIYLYNLLQEKNNLTICNSSIAQLSFHKNSMSIEYGKAPLSTGYWLSRIWCFDKSLDKYSHDKDFLSKLSSYIIIAGLFIFLTNLKKLNLNYSLNIIQETFKVVLKCIKQKIILKTISNLPLIIFNRISRKKTKYTPD
jgi:hypothetical protein